jgi:hypothetical protein
MRRLFRSFERFGVDYLLISGQAAILSRASIVLDASSPRAHPSGTS